MNRYILACLLAILGVLSWASSVYGQAGEAKLTDSNTVFHRLYVLGPGNNKAEDLNFLDDYFELKKDLEQSSTTDVQLEASSNHASGSTSTTLTRPTKEELKKELDRLKEKAQSGEEVTFYFQGHGGGGKEYGLLQSLPTKDEPYNEFIWINDANGDKTNNENEELTDDELAQMLKGFREGVTLVVLMHACFAGGFTGGAKDIQESNAVAVIGVSTTCPVDTTHGNAFGPFSGNSYVTTFLFGGAGLFGIAVDTLTEDIADGAGEKKADANGDGVVTAKELKDWLKGEGWKLGPPDDACETGKCDKPKSGGSLCVGPAGRCDLPDVTLDPTNARAGFLPVRGEGFPAGSEVDLGLISDDRSRLSSARAVTDARGGFLGHVPVTGVVPGIFMLEARSGDFFDHLFVEIDGDGGRLEEWNPRAVQLADLLSRMQGAGIELAGSMDGAQVGSPAPGGADMTVLAEGPMIYLESLGGSTGPVMRAHVVNPGPEPLAIHGYAAIEPVEIGPSERSRILEQVRQTSGAHQDLTVNFYCLELLRQAPPEGIVFRIAGPEKQESFRPMARALDATRRLYESGELSVEGDPDIYFHSIRQWAIWTLEQSFDHDGFVDAFTEHGRKNFARIGQPWSEAVEAAVRTDAERRWQDVRRVLEEDDPTLGGS